VGMGMRENTAEKEVKIKKGRNWMVSLLPAK
jgi:hypothetical protein